MRKTLFSIALFFLLATSRVSYADIYIGGHADLGVGFDAGNLHLHIHAENDLQLFGGGTALAGEYNPGDLDIGVPGPSINRPGAAVWSFLAPNAGDAVWFLPQSTDPNKPFLGIGTEDLTDAGWTTPLTWQFNSISTVSGGASSFALWQNDLFGNPTVFASSIVPGGDSWTQSALGHDHFNFGFTAEGIYDVSFTITGTNSGIDAIAAGVYSDTATFRFVVGIAIITAVPEPSGLMLVGIALGGLALRRRRDSLPR